MRGFEYLETYKKTFNAGSVDEFVRPKTIVVDKNQEVEEEEDPFTAPVPDEEKIPLTEKIKSMLSRMFEVEDQSIK
jgi:hypothetical protein